jgi:nucleotide-binding universal stress UspA family protein
MFSHVLIATDGSELALKAVRQGLELAKSLGARATALAVTEPWPIAQGGGVMQSSPIEEYEAAVTQEANRTLATVRELAGKLGVACKLVHLADEYPAEGIVEQATGNGCDLIVMASHGRRGLARLVLGSQAARVLAHSPVPVLICK